MRHKSWHQFRVTSLRDDVRILPLAETLDVPDVIRDMGYFVEGPVESVLGLKVVVVVELIEAVCYLVECVVRVIVVMSQFRAKF